MPTKAVDLSQRPPRSPRVRLGGYVILPRMLDKGRAVIAGKAGEYKYACPLDQRFLSFVGVDPEALKKQLSLGLGDSRNPGRDPEELKTPGDRSENCPLFFPQGGRGPRRYRGPPVLS